MATTRLMPLHTGNGRDVSTVISDITDYVENPEKTDYGRLITGYECDSRTADAKFLLSKRKYAALTGRTRSSDDVIAYISGSLLSPARSRRRKQTGSVVSLPNALRTETTLSSSAPTSTNTTFTIISF